MACEVSHITTAMNNAALLDKTSERPVANNSPVPGNPAEDEQQQQQEENGGGDKPRRAGHSGKRGKNFRRIPRSPSSSDTNKSSPRGNRRRTVSTSSQSSRRRPRRGDNRRRRNLSESSTISNIGTPAEQAVRKLRQEIEEAYEKRQLNLVNSYLKNRIDLAKFSNTYTFLSRCSDLQVVPMKYRLSCETIRNTSQVIRLIDRFSILCMESDMRYNRLRKNQISRLLEKKDVLLSELLKEEDVLKVKDIANEAYETKFLRIKEQQVKAFEDLLKEYDIPPKVTPEKDGDEVEGATEDAELNHDEARKEKKAEDKETSAAPDNLDEEDKAKNVESTEGNEKLEVEEPTKAAVTADKRKGKKSRKVEEKTTAAQEEIKTEVSAAVESSTDSTAVIEP